MRCAGLPRTVSRGVTVLMAGILVSACGVPPDQASTDDTGLELTLVLIEQYNRPALLTAPGEPPSYRVTADVTLAFRFADKIETLLMDFEDPGSGSRTHNEFDLTTLAPGISDATEGRWDVRVPLTIPALGALQFRAWLIDQNGPTSDPDDGGFTVQEEIGINDDIADTQIQVGTAVVF
jgi:hypothetical protein